MKPMGAPRPAVARCAARPVARRPCAARQRLSRACVARCERVLCRRLRMCASTQRHHAATAGSCISTMHQHRCSSLVLSRARAFRLAAGGAFFRTARWVARFSASRECVPSQEQQAPRSAPALLVCSHVVFCFRCAQVLSSDYAPSLWEQCHRAVGASDRSGVSLPPVSVARRRNSSHLAARALLARSPVAFCFCCAQVPRSVSKLIEQQSRDQATGASQPLEERWPGAVASADAARSGHQAPSAPCTSTEPPPRVVRTLDNSRTRGPSRRTRPSTSGPSVTTPRRPARSVNELCETTCSQFELEFDINHGEALRDSVGVWHPPMDTMAVQTYLLHDVFAPALRRATRQAYAWSISHRRTLQCPHCSRILVPSPDDRSAPNKRRCNFVPGGELSAFSPTSSGGL